MALTGNFNSTDKAVMSSRSPINQDLFAYAADFSQQTLSPELKDNLSRLARLIANAVEAYSCVIFIANRQRREIIVGGYHTLSRNFVPSSRIGYGCGLIGWCAENGVNITVSPFEAEPSTLIYYRDEKGLKSFTAMPIIDEGGQVLGVIACDSKKSYAFPKITEKVLVDFSGQCAAVMTLVKNLEAARREQIPPSAPLAEWIDELQRAGDEDDLMQLSTHLPDEIVQRDALVAITIAESGIGSGRFYAKSELDHLGHRLLDMVYKHKKVICAERSVHVLPSNDLHSRSFISVAFRVLGQEAGSLNVLSMSGQVFTQNDIDILERIARIVGSRLEHIRLRDRFSSMEETAGILSAKLFSVKGNALLSEAAQQKKSASMMRISFDNLHELEQAFGFVGVHRCIKQVVRLVEQVKGSSAIACILDSSSMLLLVESSEAKRLETRLRTLVKKIKGNEQNENFLYPHITAGEMIVSGMKISTAEFPSDGKTVESLAEKTLATLTARILVKKLEAVVNV